MTALLDEGATEPFMTLWLLFLPYLYHLQEQALWSTDLTEELQFWIQEALEDEALVVAA